MYVEDVKDRSNTPKGCNAMYVKDVKDRSNTPKGCNAMYVEDGKRTYRHTFIIPFLIWYHLNIILCMSKMSKIDQIHLRAVMLCMLKMSKIHQIHLRAVMLCMSKMSKMGKEHTHTFWLITSLILNGFSFRKKFWKAETESFPTILSIPMYVEACQRCRRLSLTSSTCFNIHSI